MVKTRMFRATVSDFPPQRFQCGSGLVLTLVCSQFDLQTSLFSTHHHVTVSISLVSAGGLVQEIKMWISSCLSTKARLCFLCNNSNRPVL